MANIYKALLCLVFLSAYTVHARAQENPSLLDTTQMNWIDYNDSIGNIDPGEYYILFREVGTGCVSDTAVFEINLLEQPVAPLVGIITHPTCTEPTGSVVLSGLPEGNWIINPGNIIGSGSTSTIIGLVAGQSYTFTVTASNNCISPPSIEVTIDPQPPTPAAPTAELNQSFCAGSLVEHLVAEYPAGTELRWYSIEDETALAPGTELATGTYYAAAVSPEGCESERVAVQVTVNPQITPELSIYTEDTLICEGESASFTAELSPSEINVSEYQWFVNNQDAGSNNATFTSSDLNNDDEVSCRVIIHGDCLADTIALSNVISIKVIPQITFAVSDSTSYGDTSGTVVLSGLETGKNYDYQLDGNNWQSYATNISGLDEGWHQIKVREDGIGCESDTVGFAINLTDSITFDLDVLADVTILGGNDGSVRLSNVAGGVGSNYTVSLNNNPPVSFAAHLTIDTLSAGTYTVQVFDEEDNASALHAFEIEQPSTFTFEAHVAQHETNAEAADGVIVIDSIYASQTLSFEYTKDNRATWDSIEQGDSITGLATGDYTIILRAGGVESEPETFTIEQTCNSYTVSINDLTDCGDTIAFFNADGLDPNKQYEYLLIPKNREGKPIITLTGDNPLYWSLGKTFVDPGATAYDERDGDITESIVVTNNVDINREGEYQITYNVTDSDGNDAEEVVREVVVAKFVMIMETSSTDNSWTPFNILNDGETLKWEVTGAVNYTVYANKPVFDFSIPGEKKIIVTSSDRGSGVTVIALSELGLHKLVLFDGLTSLQGLGCGQNQLIDLDVSHLTSITNLSCYNNQLTSLDVSNLNLLGNLDCGNNQLTSLDISQLSRLSSFLCYNNSLTSISFNEAIISIFRLVCFNNQLSELPLPPNLESIYDLNCSNNQIAYLDLSGINSLKYIDCSKNMLTELVVPAVFDDLECQQNNLTSLILPVDLISARTIKCSSNQLTSLVLPSGLTSLQSFSCGTNQLTSLVLPSGLTSLQSFSCGNNQLTSLDLSHLTELGSLSCYDNQIKSLDVSHLSDLSSLSCYDNQLSSLNISGLSNLQNLSCYNNQLTTLNTSNLTNVQRLHCYNNQINSLNLSSLVSIDELRCNDNPLKNIDLSNLQSVDLLFCHDTQLNSLYLPNLTSLNRLLCPRTPIETLMLNDNLTSIGEINCERTELGSLNLPSNLSSIRTLNLKYCKMENSDLNTLLDQIITQAITGKSISISGYYDNLICAIPSSIEAVESLFTYINIRSCAD